MATKGVQRHNLTEKDPQALTAVCSVCGPTRLASKGAGWLCINKKRANTKAWNEASPEKVKANRALSSPHKLMNKDVKASTGMCPLCGPVDILAYGRGWVCGNRARELRTTQQVKPTLPCPDCKGYADITASGKCAACAALVPGLSLTAWDASVHEVDRSAALADECIEQGFRVSHYSRLEPKDTRRDSTAPHLKVIGDRSSVDPVWAWALASDPDWDRLEQM